MSNKKAIKFFFLFKFHLYFSYRENSLDLSNHFCSLVIENKTKGKKMS